MSFRNLFPRNEEIVNGVTSEAVSSNQENGVVCDTSELKKMITKWTQNEGWQFNDFATFVELIGVKGPIKLSDWNEEKYSFKCVTALNTEVTIHIRFGDCIDYCSELWVTEGEETRRYTTNSNSQKEKTVPKVDLHGRTITRNGKELNSYYCEYFCHRTLKLDDTHMLEVKIDEPNGGTANNSDVAVLKNCQQVEEYLLGLDNSLVITKVYDNVIKLKRKSWN